MNISVTYSQLKLRNRRTGWKDTSFDREQLLRFVMQIPKGYELKRIDADIYDMCLENPATEDFVSSFGSKEKYLKLGRGMVILKDGRYVLHLFCNVLRKDYIQAGMLRI